MHTRKRWDLTLRFTALTLFSMLLLFPFLWLVSQSLKDTNQYFAIPFHWIPSPVRWGNFADVIVRYEFLHYIWNSLWLAGYAVIVNIFASSLVAYGFSRFRFPWRRRLPGRTGIRNLRCGDIVLTAVADGAVTEVETTGRVTLEIDGVAFALDAGRHTLSGHVTQTPG